MPSQEAQGGLEVKSYSIQALSALANNFGAPVERSDVDDWRGVLMVGNVTDMILDDSDDPVVGRRYHEVLTERIGARDLDYFSTDNPELHERLADAAVADNSKDPELDISRGAQRLLYYAQRFAGWPTERQSQHLDGLDDLRTESARKRVVTDVEVQREIREREALLCNVFLRLYPETDRNRDFHDYLDIAMRRACYWDDAVDLPYDYQRGVTQVRPTVRNRLYLAHAAFRNPMEIIEPIGPEAGHMMGKLVVSLFRDRFMRGQSLPLLGEAA